VTPDPRVSAEQLGRVAAIFAEALARDAEARPAYLREACGPDEGVRQEVESLLAAHERSTTSWETSALHAHLRNFAVDCGAGESRIGMMVGPYRLVRLIAQGGMGAVYEAERADAQFHQRVAVKFLRHGIPTAQARRRFEHERAIQARLQHRNIAGLFDGGVLPDGQPYFVMEYVDGVPITTYAANRSLSVSARLQLMRQVCRAVHYAHEHQVVHRDLKPSNILVTTDGTVKLLDFGIARLLEGSDDDVPLTQGGDRALTLEYASPEQLNGQAVTAASDVYSLGVVLYELLAGRRPFLMSELPIAEAIRQVTEVPPAPPSVALGPAAPESVRRAVRGELDDITAMTLRKEPERRYASADALAHDLAAWEQGRPVSATADTVAYSIRKFVRRHRWQSASAVLLLLSLVVGASTTWWQARRAEARYRDGRRLANALLSDVHSVIADLPGATAARAALIAPALEYLDRTSREIMDDPALDRELAFAYQRIGDVQGNPTNANLGDVAGARASYQKALDIAERVYRRLPADEGSARLVALVSERLADVGDSAGNVSASMAHQERAVQLYTTIAQRWPSHDASHQLAVSRLKRGDLAGHPAFRNLGDTAGAMRDYRSALALLERDSSTSTDVYRNRRYRSLILERMGRIAGDGGGADAPDLLARSLAQREQLAALRPGSVDAQRDVAIGHFLLCGLYQARAELDKAQASCEASFRIRHAIYRADPKNVQLLRGMGLIHRRLGDIAASSADRGTARVQYRSALAFYDTLAMNRGAGRADSTDRAAIAARLIEIERP
jgi:non-specific serine/threonine protein kinase/serine/threonine-protein kinase